MNKDQLIKEQLGQIKQLITLNQEKFKETEYLKEKIFSLEENLLLYNNKLAELETTLHYQEEKYQKERDCYIEKNQKLENQNKRLLINLGEVQEQVLRSQKEIQSILIKNDELSQEFEENLRKNKDLMEEQKETKKIIDQKNYIIEKIQLENEELQQEKIENEKFLLDYREILSKNQEEILLLTQKQEEYQMILNEKINENSLLLQDLQENLKEKGENEEIVIELQRKIEEQEKEISKFQKLFLHYNMEIMSSKNECNEKEQQRMSIYEGEIQNYKQILNLKEAELNKQVFNIHLKNEELMEIKEEINKMIESLQKEDSESLLALQSKAPDLIKMRNILFDYIRKQKKYEKFFSKLKKKKTKEMKETEEIPFSKRFSENMKPKLYFQQENAQRVNTELGENEEIHEQIRNLTEHVNYLEKYFK